MPPNCVLNFQQLLSAEKRENVNCRIPLSGRVRSAKKKEDLSFPRSSKISSFYFRMSNQNFCPFFLFPLFLSLIRMEFFIRAAFLRGSFITTGDTTRELPPEIERRGRVERARYRDNRDFENVAKCVENFLFHTTAIRHTNTWFFIFFSFFHLWFHTRENSRWLDSFFFLLFFLYFTRQTRKCRESC